jgi:hypothetical protein
VLRPATAPSQKGLGLSENKRGNTTRPIGKPLPQGREAGAQPFPGRGSRIEDGLRKIGHSAAETVLKVECASLARTQRRGACSRKAYRLQRPARPTVRTSEVACTRDHSAQARTRAVT